MLMNKDIEIDAYLCWFVIFKSFYIKGKNTTKFITI